MVTFLQHLLILPKNMNAISIAGSLACLGLLLLTWNLISSKCHYLGQSWFVDLSIVKTWAIAALLHSQTLDHLPKAAVSVQPSKPEALYLYLVMVEPAFDPAYISYNDLLSLL